MPKTPQTGPLPPEPQRPAGSPEPEYLTMEDYEDLEEPGAPEPAREGEEPAYEGEEPAYEEENSVPGGDEPAEEPPVPPRRRRPRYIPETGHGCLVGLMYTALLLGLSMIISAGIILFSNEVFAFVKPDVTTVVEIQEGDGIGDVAKKLHEAGIISYPALFTLYMEMAKSDVEFKPGQYEVSARLDYPAIVRTLRSKDAKRETVRVTIPEGYTTAQILQLLVDKKAAVSVEELTRVIETYDFHHDFVKELPKGKNRLDGYLFPDTYEFYVWDTAKGVKGDTPENVIAKFLDNFGARFDSELREYVTSSGRKLRDIVIIASMIEREAKLADERELVSSVIYNRLKNDDFPYLQIDATVQYIVGHAPTPADLEIDNPYNTYLYPGLPPGPIASPGLSALEAAVWPAQTDYYYYVARSNGSHIFSRTLEEHNAAIASLRED